MPKPKKIITHLHKHRLIVVGLLVLCLALSAILVQRVMHRDSIVIKELGVSFPRVVEIKDISYHYLPAHSPHFSYESVDFTTQLGREESGCNKPNGYFSLGYMVKYPENSMYAVTYDKYIPIAEVSEAIKVGSDYYVFHGESAPPSICPVSEATQMAFKKQVDALHTALKSMRPN